MVRVTEAPKTVKEIAYDFAVSERTARRHLAKGTLPDTHRKMGPHKKSYPAGMRKAAHEYVYIKQTPLHHELTMAKNAVRRLARANAFNERDIPVLCTIAEEAAALLQAWEETVRLYQAEAAHLSKTGR
jgi:predicted transcriptional regulator